MHIHSVLTTPAKSGLPEVIGELLTSRLFNGRQSSSVMLSRSELAALIAQGAQLALAAKKHPDSKRTHRAKLESRARSAQ